MLGGLTGPLDVQTLARVVPVMEREEDETLLLPVTGFWPVHLAESALVGGAGSEGILREAIGLVEDDWRGGRVEGGEAMLCALNVAGEKADVRTTKVREREGDFARARSEAATLNERIRLASLVAVAFSSLIPF